VTVRVYVVNVVDDPQHVVLEHLWLADSIARRFQGRGQDPEDLEQVARAGLVEAVRRFDPDHGPFLAFATPTITGVVKRHFRDQGWFVRPPRRTQELAGRIRSEWAELAQQLRSEPTTADLAERLAESPTAVHEARRAAQGFRWSSLDTVEANPSLSVQIFDHDDREAMVMLRGAWPRLTEDERRLLRMRFFDEMSQSQIAAELGSSQMQVSRLLARTLRRLRSLLGVVAGAEA
jgi:RNA polymerase sigma-B factor